MKKIGFFYFLDNLNDFYNIKNTYHQQVSNNQTDLILFHNNLNFKEIQKINKSQLNIKFINISTEFTTTDDILNAYNDNKSKKKLPIDELHKIQFYTTRVFKYLKNYHFICKLKPNIQLPSNIYNEILENGYLFIHKTSQLFKNQFDCSFYIIKTCFWKSNKIQKQLNDIEKSLLIYKENGNIENKTFSNIINNHLYPKSILNFDKSNNNYFKIKEDDFEKIKYSLSEFNETTLINNIKNDKINFSITSYGGCGTNALLKILQDKFIINKSIWNYKLCHYIKPLTSINLKYSIYIYGDPLNSIISQNERNGIYGSLLRLNFYKMKPANSIVKYSLENVLKQMSQQIKNWTNPNVNYPVILIKYESLETNIPKLCQYLGIDTIDFVFKKKNDRTELRKFYLDLIQEKKLTQSFNQLNQQYHSLPDFQIIEPN